MNRFHYTLLGGVVISMVIALIILVLPSEVSMPIRRGIGIALTLAVVIIYWHFIRALFKTDLDSYELVAAGAVCLALGFLIPSLQLSFFPRACGMETVCFNVVQALSVVFLSLTFVLKIAGPIAHRGMTTARRKVVLIALGVSGLVGLAATVVGLV